MSERLKSLARWLGGIIHHPLKALRDAGLYFVAHPFRATTFVLLMAVGLSGLVLPILPGWVLIFAAFALLGPKNRLNQWARARLHNLRQRLRRKK